MKEGNITPSQGVPGHHLPNRVPRYLIFQQTVTAQLMAGESGNAHKPEYAELN
jgi:hypothetical protein